MVYFEKHTGVTPLQLGKAAMKKIKFLLRKKQIEGKKGLRNKKNKCGGLTSNMLGLVWDLSIPGLDYV